MAIPQVSPNAVFFVTGGLFIVWMQRQKRWSLLLNVMNGGYAIVPIGPKNLSAPAGSTTNPDGSTTETLGGHKFVIPKGDSVMVKP